MPSVKICRVELQDPMNKQNVKALESRRQTHSEIYTILELYFNTLSFEIFNEKNKSENAPNPTCHENAVKK